MRFNGIFLLFVCVCSAARPKNRKSHSVSKNALSIKQTDKLLDPQI